MIMEESFTKRMERQVVLLLVCCCAQCNSGPRPQSIAEYLETVVRPSLQGKRGEELLVELDKRWGNHLIMNKWLMKFFTYLVRHDAVLFAQLPRLTRVCFPFEGAAGSILRRPALTSKVEKRRSCCFPQIVL